MNNNVCPVILHDEKVFLGGQNVSPVTPQSFETWGRKRMAILASLRQSSDARVWAIQCLGYDAYQARTICPCCVEDAAWRWPTNLSLPYIYTLTSSLLFRSIVEFNHIFFLVVVRSIYRSPSVDPPMGLSTCACMASAGPAAPPGPPSPTGVGGTRTTLRKSIGDSFCIISTIS